MNTPKARDPQAAGKRSKNAPGKRKGAMKLDGAMEAYQPDDGPHPQRLAGAVDPFPAWLAEWKAALAIHTANNDNDIDEELYDAVSAIQGKIIDTQSQTMAGLFTKLKVMTDCLVKGGVPSEEWAMDTLEAAEAVMRGPGVAAVNNAILPTGQLDNELLEDAVRWHALQDLLDNLDGECECLYAKDAKRFEHLKSFDPRGWDLKDYPSDSRARQIVQDLIAFEPIYVSCGLAAVNDRREAVHDEQDLITKRIKDAYPVTVRGKAALVGVMFRAINHDLLRNNSDDWDVEVAVKARDMLALIEADVCGPGVVTAGEVDPLVALFAQWLDARDARPPEGMDVDGSEGDRFMDEMCDVMQDFEALIMASPPKTVAGAHVQLFIILEWLEGGMSTDSRGHFARLLQSISDNLNVLADQGGAS